MAITDKLITLGNLTAFNHQLCSQLGLAQDTLGYTAPSGKGTAGNVKAALDELYDKIGAILGGESTSAGVKVAVSTTGVPTVTVTPGAIEANNTSVVTGGAVFTAIEGAKATGGESNDNGVSVSIEAGTAVPTVTVTTGAVEEGNTSVVTGGDVYTAIEGAKAADKYVTVAGQAVTSTSGLISGTLAITSNTTGGSASLSVNPTLTTSTKTATAIATKEYVDEQLTASEIEYSFGEDATFGKVGSEDKYTVTIPLMKSVGGAAATQADEIVLTLNTDEFVKDSFLQDAKMGTGEKVDTLILTMKMADGTTKDIEVDLSKFIDTYTGGKGIDITDHKISVDVASNGYLGFTADTDTGKLTILDSKLAKGTSTTGAAATNLATQGYVDDKVAGQAVTVDKTDVSAFGTSGSIDVKQNGTSVGEFTVTLPALTATKGTSTSTNVEVGLTDGAVSVTTKEQGATDTTTYNNTKLAQAAYVDEKIAKATVAHKGGSNQTTAPSGADVATNGSTYVIESVVNGVTTVTTGNLVASDDEVIGLFTAKA